MQKTPYVFPILGGRKVEQLYANFEALDIALTPEHIKKLEAALPFDLGFPSKFIVSGFCAHRLGYSPQLRRRVTVQRICLSSLYRSSSRSGLHLSRFVRRGHRMSMVSSLEYVDELAVLDCTVSISDL